MLQQVSSWNQPSGSLYWIQPVLDNTFNGTGYHITKSILRDDIGGTVLVQPNGRILTGNSFNMIGYSNIAITRMKPDGTMDNSFGTGGIATIPVDFLRYGLIAQWKIIVAGLV